MSFGQAQSRKLKNGNIFKISKFRDEFSLTVIELGKDIIIQKKFYFSSFRLSDCLHLSG